MGNLMRHLLRQPNINFPNLAMVAANPSFSTNAFVPYPGYTSITQFRSDSTGNYNALQLYAAKQVGRITGTTGYTWSKALGDSSGEGDNVENWQNRHYNYGPTTFDRRHVFYANFVGQLPSLKGRPVYLRGPLGGWQLSGVIRFQTGQYYTVTGSTITGTRRANYVGGPLTVSNPGSALWFNKAAFTAAPISAYGNSGAGIVEGPPLKSVDLSIAKHFSFTERFDLKFQGDFFNAINQVNFSTLNVVTSSSSFGTLSAAYPPRQVQLSVKLAF